MSKNSDQDLAQVKIDLIDLTEELRSYTDMLWHLDSLLWEYLDPIGQPSRHGSTEMHLSVLSVRYLIMKEIRQLLTQIQQIGD